MEIYSVGPVYGYGEHMLRRILAYNSKKNDKRQVNKKLGNLNIGIQCIIIIGHVYTCNIYQNHATLTNQYADSFKTPGCVPRPLCLCYQATCIYPGEV